MKELEALALPLRGRCLIEASAGTGKTYTITTLVLRLLLEEQLELEQVLVVTYTRAATAELRARVRARIAALYQALSGETEPEDEALAGLRRASIERGSLDEDRRRIQRAMYATDEAAIFTIHGFCQRVLGDYAFETDTPFALELRAHSESLVAEVVRDYWTLATQHIDPTLYGRLRSKGPESIESLVLATLHGPLPRLVPEEPDAPRPDTATWHAALDSLRSHWADGRATLLDAMLNAKTGLAKKTFHKLFGLVDALVEDAPLPLEAESLAALQRLAGEVVDRAAAKGRDITHPLLPHLGALRDADLAQAAWFDAQHRKLLREAVFFARRELSLRTTARNEATFDQLLSRTHEALTGPRRRGLVQALQRRYRAALIDEFQDTDPLQYEVFARAFDGLPLLLIGDPKQAIYGFRGADVFAYLQAREGVGDAVYTLSTNRRSDPGLIHGLNHVYARCERPFAIDSIRYVPVSPPPGARDGLQGGGAPLELLFAEPHESGKAGQEAEVCERLASDIVRALSSDTRIEGRALRAGDIAVLCRKNKQAHAVQQALASRGVPSLLQGDSSVFDTPDAAELERLLAALVDPADSRTVRGALAGAYLGLDAQRIDALSEDDAWDTHRERLLEAHRTWSSRGFIQGVRQCLRAYRVDERLMARPDGARRWTNLQHLLELLQEAALQQRLGPDGLLRFLRTMRTDLAMRAELLGESAQIRLESLEDAVRLTTVHRSKGLEYPVVYCPFAWEGPGRPAPFPLVHAPEGDGQRVLDLGSPPLDVHRERAALEAASDDLRVLYVALTRAKHALRVVCGPLGGKQARPGALHHLLGLEARQAPEAMRAHLQDLAAGSGGALRVRELSEASPQPLQRPPAAPVEAEARPMPRDLSDPEHMTSFTALSHGAPDETAADDGQDHDALETPAAEASAPASPAASGPMVALADFPRGASAGTAIHELLERVDFAADAATLTSEAETHLPARGMPASLASALGHALHDVLRTPLDTQGMRLCDVAPADRVPELEFLFRVDPARPLGGRALAQLLRAHGAPTASPAYATRVERLDFRNLRGFLRGFVDLVFCHGGRFYVVDYKSNDLGPRADDYRPERLAEAMGQHHYYLQYLLYGIAVHRMLRQRVPGYDYETHFGGVHYLFLRGMSPARGPSTGVFSDRPSAALMAELDAALTSTERAP